MINRGRKVGVLADPLRDFYHGVPVFVPDSAELYIVHVSEGELALVVEKPRGLSCFVVLRKQSLVVCHLVFQHTKLLALVCFGELCQCLLCPLPLLLQILVPIVLSKQGGPFAEGTLEDDQALTNEVDNELMIPSKRMWT